MRTSQVEYRIDAMTLGDHPSQNRRWHSFTKADSPQSVIRRIRSLRSGERIKIENVWAKVPKDWWNGS